MGGMGEHVQNSNPIMGGKLQGSGYRTLGMQDGIQENCREMKLGDGDPCVIIEAQEKPKMQPKMDRPGNLPTKWASLFGVKPSGKSSFPPVKVVSRLEKGSCTISILDEIVDHSIASMASMLVGKFIGPKPNIDVVRSYTMKKCSLKG